MNPLKVIIADDDQSSKLLLAQLIELLPEYQIIGEASNGDELVQLVMKEKPEIILVDINMPGLNGIEAVKICKMMEPAVQVIFTTGYQEFAVEAFNLSAADYLVKPIEKVRFFLALQKAKLALQFHKREDTPKNKLVIKSQNSFVYLDVLEILFIEKDGRKTVLHTENDVYETLESLQEMEERLPNYFFKTHRSFLVNLRKINQIEAVGETYIARFPAKEKQAYISKLKIHDVHRLMGMS